jgi:hypothetical protein
MPFWRTESVHGHVVDFPAVYQQVISPAIVEAGMTPLRADEDPDSLGVFQKSMFERLVLCEFAVADLSTGNPNVYYELGIRHALRPHSTVLLFRRGYRLPLDLAHGAAIDYPVDTDGIPSQVPETVEKLVRRLTHARQSKVDSPVHQLVSGLPVLEVDHERLDAFREHADRDVALRRRLDEAVAQGVSALREVESEFGPLEDIDVETALSLSLSYRSVGAYDEMVRVMEGLPQWAARLEMVRQQYAWALNRCGRRTEAERLASELLQSRPSSETYGLMGRIYKDLWSEEPSEIRRAGLLDRAITTYLRGFEADWRDPYPGINAATLMFLREPPDQRLADVLPVVRYACERRLARHDREPDYWDHVTDLSVRVLERDQEGAMKALTCALAAAQDGFQAETTARDLSWVAETMNRRGECLPWLRDVIDELQPARPSG